ncbi:MAG: phage portal protein [Agromyces sp.]
MALPTSDPNAQWPPKQLDTILPAMARWSAWFSNDLERLQMVYGGGLSPDAGNGFFASQTGGFKAAVGRTLQRWFVGKPSAGVEQNTKLAIPIAAEMCQASADLLFADPVTVTVGPAPVAPKLDTAPTDATPAPKAPNPTQDRVETLLDEEFHTRIAEGAELGAALGGVYLRVTWDTAVKTDGPFTTIVDADQAVPEFRWGRLVAVTFWSVVHTDGKLVYRHLERHELDAFGNGVIRHGLYQGENDKLGIRVSLGTRTETAGLAVHVDLNDEGTIDTKSAGLAVTYVSNQTPNRMWRHDPLGKNLGRSDLDGVEHLMDQLAENYSDWMRARRAARARVMHAKDLMKSEGPGKAATIDVDQETYVNTSMPKGGGTTTPKMADLVQVLQPTFDPEGYRITGEALVEKILEMAGYSTQTFGVQPEGGGDRTATEIEAKERRSLMTRSRKIREWKPKLRQHVIKLLEVDNTFFGGKNVTSDIDIEFADGVQESQIKLGQFVQSLYASESADVVERVSILHPDWDEDQINRQADAIRKEFAHEPMNDPAMDPFGDRDADEPQA